MIKVDDYCPGFKLLNQDSLSIDMSEKLGNSIIILFFHPKDDTPGCTKEACRFRDTHQDFQDLGCTVFGISSDSTKSHKKFAANYQLPFDLLSDEGGKIRKLFAVPTNLFGLIPGRVTYIIGKDKKIHGIYNSQTDPIGHVSKALEFAKQLAV